MLALILADVLPIPRNFEFSPDPGPYIAIFGIGFMVAILGHISQSKFLIATGLLMIFSSIVVIPLVVYLGQ